MYLINIGNIISSIILMYFMFNKRINKSILKVLNIVIVIIIAMAISYYIKESSVLITFFLTRYGRSILKLMSKIKIKPSKSMPDFTNIDLVIIFKNAYYSLTSPFKFQIMEMQKRMLEIYLQIIRQIKQMFGKTSYSFA